MSIEQTATLAIVLPYLIRPDRPLEIVLVADALSVLSVLSRVAHCPTGWLM